MGLKTRLDISSIPALKMLHLWKNLMTGDNDVIKHINKTKSHQGPLPKTIISGLSGYINRQPVIVIKIGIFPPDNDSKCGLEVSTWLKMWNGIPKRVL